MLDDWTNLLLAALVAALPVVRAYVKAKLTPERLAHVADLARTIVNAAEQIGDDYDDVNGASKLRWATSALAAGAKRLGLKLSEPELDAFIHAALREMHAANGTEPTETEPADEPSKWAATA